MKILSQFFAQLDIDPNRLEIPQPGAPTDSTVSNVLQLIFGVASAIALLIVVIAGIQFIASRGEPQATAKARNAIIYAGVGLVIASLAFSIVTFVVERTS